MSLYIRQGALLCLLAAPSSACWAAEVAYAFTGTVFNNAGNPWGYSVPVSTPVSGRFIFGSNSIPTQDLGVCDCAGYRQQVINGFSAVFGNVPVRTDEYVVVVHNRAPGAGKDIFTVRFAHDFVPPLTEPIFVDHVSYPTGLFDITLNDANGTLYSDASLPASLSLSDYPSRVGRLRDTTSGPADVLFTIDTLRPLERGDYDFSGQINNSDYHQWISAYGSPTQLSPDGNHDGAVDAADYALWRKTFDATPAGAGGTTNQVPEPARLLMLAAAASFTMRPPRRVNR